MSWFDLFNFFFLEGIQVEMASRENGVINYVAVVMIKASAV